jgi:hypothetical protein
LGGPHEGKGIASQSIGQGDEIDIIPTHESEEFPGRFPTVEDRRQGHALQRITLGWPTGEENGDWLPALQWAIFPEKTPRAGCLSPFSGCGTAVNRCKPRRSMTRGPGSVAGEAA